MSKSTSGPQGSPRTRISVAGLAVMAGLLGVLALPGTASAARAECVASATFTDELAEVGFAKGMSYSFACTETIKGFSIIANRELAYFEPEVAVYNSETGEATSEQFACEGPIPGLGFGCGGSATLGNVTQGTLASLDAPCSRKLGPIRLQLIVASEDINPFSGAKSISSSRPFRVKGPDCPQPKRRNRR